MIKRYTRKMIAVVNSNHSECGATQMTNHFIGTHNVAGNTTVSSLIAAIPCMRHVASRIKAKWSVWMGKIV